MEACHRPDPTRTNTHFWNLRWDTRSRNMTDRLDYVPPDGINPNADRRHERRRGLVTLTKEDVIAIRQMAYDGYRTGLIATKYNLLPRHVTHILKGYTWGHLDPEGLARFQAHRAETHVKKDGSGNLRRDRRLDEAQVIEIRRLAAEGVKLSKLAHRYGVAYNTIYDVVHRKNWRHLHDSPTADGTPARSKRSARLAPEQVREIRRLLGEGRSQSAVAKQFDILQSTVNGIAYRRLYASID